MVVIKDILLRDNHMLLTVRQGRKCVDGIENNYRLYIPFLPETSHRQAL